MTPPLVPWNLSGKTVVLTGGTDGIGKAVLSGLLHRGATVIVLARNSTKAEQIRDLHRAHADRLHCIECDLSSLASVDQAARRVCTQYKEVQVLINVAGVMPLTREESTDGIELNWAVNYLAPVLLTERMLPRLCANAPARIINVTSSLYKLGSIDLEDMRAEHVSDRYQAYGNSKMALLLYTRALARELSGSGITVNAVHPGWIRTTLATTALKKSNVIVRTVLSLLRMRPAWYGARTILYLAAHADLSSTSGEYFIKNRIVKTNEYATDLVRAQSLLSATRDFLKPYCRS